MAVAIPRAAIVTSWSGLPISGLLHTGASITQAADDINYPDATSGVPVSVDSLRTVTGTLEGILPTPEIGNGGSVTYSDGYAASVQSWSMTIGVDALDVTTFGGSGTSTRYRQFVPGNYNWSGQYTALVDDATGLSESGEDSAGAATFTLSSGDTLAGNIYSTNLNLPVTINQTPVATYSYRGSGTLAAAGTNNIITAGSPISLPSASTLTFKYADNTTDGTFEVDAFWTSLAVTVTPGEQTRVSVNWQGTGAVTNTAPAGA